MIQITPKILIKLLILIVLISSCQSFFFNMFSKKSPSTSTRLLDDHDYGQDGPEYGECSWYEETRLGHPEMTASGEMFNKNDLIAAHPDIPFNSYVAVTNVDSGRSVVVRIVDRGPFVVGRILALSPAAFSQVADLEDGVFTCTSELA